MKLFTKFLLMMCFLLPRLAISQIAIPYTETFSGIAAANGFPTVSGGAWTRSGTTTTQPTYIANQTTYNRSGNGDTKFMAFNYNASTRYFFVGPFALTSGTSYTAKVLYKADGLTGFGPLALTYGTTAAAGTQTNTIVSIPANITNANYQSLSGAFVPSTTGNFYVAIKCTADGNPWYLSVDDFSLKLTPTCVEPSALVSSAVTNNAATITWTASTSSPSGGYNYYVSTSSTAPTAGTTPTGSVSAGVTTANLTSLTANTTYYYWVRSNCGGGDLSAWAGSSTFTTACNADTAPTSIQTFTTFTGSAPAPSCWSEATTTTVASPSVLTVANSEWLNSTGFANTGTNVAVKTNLYGTDTDDWMISQAIDLGLTPSLYRVKYSMAVTGYNSTTVQTTLGTHLVRVIVSTDGGNTWNLSNTIKTYTGAGTYSATGQTETIDLTGYSGIVKIAFVATTASTATDIDFHIDDFSVELIPTCAEPTALVSTAVTNNAATISWTAPALAPANGYEYYTSTTNTAPNAGTTATGSVAAGVTTVNLTSLTANTTYYYWVRSACGASDKSPWAGSGIFTTTCDPTVITAGVSWTENFETPTVPALPSCWSKIDGNSDGDAWITSTSNPRGGTKCARLYTDFNSSNQDYLITPALTLPSTPQRLKFWVRAQSTGEPDEISVKLATNSGSSVSDYTVTLMPSTPVNTITYVEYSIDLSAYINQTVKVAFVREGTPFDGYYLHLDDVLIEDVPACQEPTALTATSITHNSATLSWTDPNTPAAPSYDVELILASATATGTPTASGVANNYAASGLTPTTAYKYYVRPNCTSGTPAWAGPFSFTTSVDCSGAIALTCATPTTTGVITGSSAYSNNACGFATPGPEKLYSFTSTSAGSYSLNITSINGASGYLDYMFKAASGGCDATGWTCIDDNSAVGTDVFTLAAATTYYILVDAETAVNLANHTFQIDCPCDATPTAGTVSGASIRPTCPGVTPSAIAVTGASALGTTYQWEESDDNGATDPWASVTTGTGGTTLSFTPAAFSGTTIYYRLNVSCSASGLTAATTSVAITPPATPTTEASNVVGNVTSLTAATINWTSGSGGRRYVVVNTTNSFTDPVGTGDVTVAGTVYAGTGEQIVYDGTGTSVSITGLVTGTTYYARVYEYLRCIGTPNTNYYNTTNATNTSIGFTPQAPANDEAANAVDITSLINSNNTCTLSFTGSNVSATSSSTVGGVPAVGSTSCSDSDPNPLDIWYKLTVPAASFGQMTFDFVTNPGFSSIVQAYTYDGANYAPVSSICNNSASRTFMGLPIGANVYFRVWDYASDNFGTFNMCVKYNTAVPPTIPTTATTSCASSTGVAISNGSNAWQYLQNASGSVIAAVKDNGSVLGSIDVSYFAPTAAARQDAQGTYYMNRNIAITPANPGNPATVRIYYTAAELTNLQAAVPSTSAADLNVTHVSGASCATTFSGLGTLIVANDGTDAIGSYIEFTTPSFSAFFINAGAAALPISLKSFTAVESGSSNLINWETAVEENVRSFVVEKSNDAKNWTALGTELPNAKKVYRMNDNAPFATTYYRLRNIDNDGREDVSKVVSVNRKTGKFTITSIAPNPTSADLTVKFETIESSNVSINVVDIFGKVIISQKVEAIKGFNTVNVNTNEIPVGAYYLNINDGVNTLTQRVVKQ